MTLEHREVTPADAVGGNTAVRLLLTCGERVGIVAAVGRFMAESRLNILTSDQFSTGSGEGDLFMRVEFDGDIGDLDTLRSEFERLVGKPFAMTWSMWPVREPKRVALLCSKYDHCLLDLLWRWSNGELHADITKVISNHDDLRSRVEAFGIEYHHVPVTSRDAKAGAERRMLELLAGEVDLVVLARYMQILSPEFLDGVGCPVINIHHSFLPAFAGADPYARAHERGVKLIGATAHYVTAELDAGPIIEQDVARVSHSDDTARLTQVGADIERVVLARAVARHLSDSVVVYDNRTVVF